jgi:hypothetical protein
MLDALNWSSIAVGFLSGALWFYASRIKVPTNIGSAYGTLVGVEAMTAGLQRQANWNTYAAAATALAAVLQASARYWAL